MTTWRDHPKLRDRLAPEHPDDVQVIVHDGGPRLTDRTPELVWVTVTRCNGDLFSGRVLNEPQQLVTVKQDDEVNFVVPDGGEYPLMVTEKYWHERSNWTIEPCDRCGLSELFDAPSDLMRAAFPDTPPDAIMEMFTAICGACGGVQVVQYEDTEIDDSALADQPRRAEPRKWWRFWML